MTYLIPKGLKSEKLTPSARAKVLKSIQGYRSVEDVVAYLFAEVKSVEVTADDERLHSFFFKLKKKHPVLLAELDFTCGDLFPYSHGLQSSIFNLQSSGLMEATNPVYEIYRIPKDAKRALIERLTHSFSASEKKELEMMGKELEQLLREG